MAEVVFNGVIYECARAVKGVNYINLYDEDNNPIISFKEITDFSPFILAEGEWERGLSTDVVSATAEFNAPLITLTLLAPVLVDTGLTVTFKAPCDSTEALPVGIGSERFTLMDNSGKAITPAVKVFESGTFVSIILDLDMHQAHIQNAPITPEQLGLPPISTNEYGGIEIGANTEIDSTGVAIGEEAQSIAEGVAIGILAQSHGDGGAIGYQAKVENGGAVGSTAKAGDGGAVGAGAQTGAGFAGGASAVTKKYSDTENKYIPIDAIQLGRGTNSNEKTLQIYDYQLLDARGKIPEDRLGSVSKIATGSYVGTGLSGEENRCKIGPLDFEPKVVFVSQSWPAGGHISLAPFVREENKAWGGSYGTSSGELDGYSVHVIWEGNSVAWYYAPPSAGDNLTDATRAALQLNSDTTYYWAVIG